MPVFCGLLCEAYLRNSRYAQAAAALGERGMDPDFIRRLCEILGVSAEDVIDGGGEVILYIDPIKLTELVVLSRERLGNLPEDEAGVLVRALILASRKPQP